MNKAALVLCGVVVVACTAAWSPAAAEGDQPCPSASAGTDCEQMTPNVKVPSGTQYTVSKTASPAGHVEPGDQVVYTVTVQATAAASGAGFTDVLDDVLDDAQYGNDVQADIGSVSYADGVVSWAGSLTSGQSAHISYSVTVDNPDGGDGLLRNDVEPSPDTGGTCESCAVANAVGGTFTVRESASPEPGSTVRPGDTITHTVDVVGGGAPTYASFVGTLSANADYAGDAQASVGTVNVQGNTVHWTGKLRHPGDTATITFSATVSAAGSTNQLTSTVEPVDNDPYQGSCAANGACQVSYRVVAPTDSGTTTSATTASVTSPAASAPSRSDSAVAGANPTTSLPRIADTGAKTAGLSTLAALLLFSGLGLLLLGWAPRQRARHRY